MPIDRQSAFKGYAKGYGKGFGYYGKGKDSELGKGKGGGAQQQGKVPRKRDRTLKGSGKDATANAWK